jgi:hypothetical protein
VYETRTDQQSEVLDELGASEADLSRAEPRFGQTGRGPVGVSDELHEQTVSARTDRVRDVHVGAPRLLHHVELVTGPTARQQLLAVVRHPLGGALVSRLGELSAVAVSEVVHEPVAALETERGQLALLGHGAGSVPLVGQQAGTGPMGPFDDEDFGFLA